MRLLSTAHAQLPPYTNPYTFFECYATMPMLADARRYSYFELGLPVMGVEEKILAVLGNTLFDILSLSPTIRPCKIKESIKRKQRNSKHKQLVAT